MADIISLTGDLGSGKSTVSSILCSQLSYEYIYTGQIQRNIAERYSMTTNELNVYAETHPEIDQEIDDTFRSLGDAHRLVVDSRLAWFFIPNSFKVFLKTNIIVSAQRIAKDTLRINENYASLQEAAMGIIERKKSEVKRYKQYYNVDCLDLTNYHLIIDTTEILPEQVGEIILSEFRNFNLQGNDYKNKAFISPKNLLPTNTADTTADKIEIAYNNAFDYIIRGHILVENALKENLPIVEVSYINSEDIVPSPDIINQWEIQNNFKFLIKP